MQAATYEQAQSQSQGLTVSLEWVAYLVLIVLALILRVAELDTVPLTAREATEALAAWRTLHPLADVSAPISQSPILFALHSLSLTLFGGSESFLRIATALGGVLLIASPLLFRDMLGRTRTFLLSLLLFCSPILFAASRLDTPAVWAMLAAVLGLWALWRWWLSSQRGFALVASGFFGAVVLLTDPAGFVLALILLAAGYIALTWEQSDEPDEAENLHVRERFRQWPWLASLLVIVLVTVAVATLLMSYTPGLSAVSELLGRGLAGLTQPRPNAPPLFPLISALFYEPFLWVFGVFGVWLAARRGEMTLVERFFSAWLVLAGVASLIYRGAGPEHALWLIIPAAGLASWTFSLILEDVTHPFLDVPRWSKWLLALTMMALLAIFAINLQGVGRSLLRTPEGSILTLVQGYGERISMSLFGESAGQAIAVDPVNMIWALIALALILLGGFLAASLWGATATLRGGALGLLLFGLVTSLGSGWSIAVTHVEDPAELWHVEATGREVFLLRETLAEVGERETRGQPELPIYALVDPNGIGGWILRDYINTTYINDASEARGQEIALLPLAAESPDLAGDYVGQEFIVSRVWRPQTLQGFDFVAWWAQRRTRVPAVPDQTLVLWLRQDVYNGVPFDPAAQN